MAALIYPLSKTKGPSLRTHIPENLPKNRRKFSCSHLARQKIF